MTAPRVYMPRRPPLITTLTELRDWVDEEFRILSRQSSEDQAAGATSLADLEAQLAALDARVTVIENTNFRDRLGTYTDFNILMDGSDETTKLQAWSEAVNDPLGMGRGLIELTGDGFIQTTAPALMFDRQVDIAATGAWTCFIVGNWTMPRWFDPTDTPDALPILDIRTFSSGSRFQGVNCYAGAGNALGGLLGRCWAAEDGHGSHTSNYHFIDCIFDTLSTVNEVDMPFVFDGSRNITGAQGIRAFQLSHCMFQGGIAGAVWFETCRSVTWNGGGCYPRSAVGDRAGAILITGTTDDSVNIVLNIENANGLIMNKAKQVSGTIASLQTLMDGSGVSLVNTGDTENCSLNGMAFGTIDANWVNSQWIGVT